MAYTDSIPAVGNQISSDLVAMEANFAHIKAVFTALGVWDGTTPAGVLISTLSDADGDTKIQVEESADEDIIRFDIGGVEVGSITSTALNVGGSIIVSTNLDVIGATNVDTLSTSGVANVGGALTVTGSTNLGTLGATGAAVLSSTLDVIGATNLGTLSTSGAANIGGALAVTGSTNLGAVSASSTLDVTGSTNLGAVSASSTLDVSGNVTMSGSLTVALSTNLGPLNTSGATTLDSLGVVGNSTLSGTLTVIGSTNLAYASVANDFGVSGSTTLSGELNVGGDLNVSGVISHTNYLAASVYVSTAINMTSTGITVLAFDSEEFDPGGDFDTTSTFRYVASAAGFYQINTQVSFGSMDPSDIPNIKIRVNGTAVTDVQFPVGLGTTSVLTSSKLVYLGSTDTVDVVISESVLSTGSYVITDGVSKTFMTIIRVA